MADNYDKKAFVDLLLLPYQSDETKKARRNLSVTSAAVIALKIVNVDISGGLLSFLRMSEERQAAGQDAVLWLAVVLIVYWMVMFYFHRKHDAEIQRERAVLIDDAVQRARDEIQQSIDQIQVNSEAQPLTIPELPHIQNAKQIVKAYDAQKARTERAARYGILLEDIQSCVPHVLALVALALLAEAIFVR